MITVESFTEQYNARRKERMGIAHVDKKFKLEKNKKIKEGERKYEMNEHGIPVLVSQTPSISKKVFDTNKFNELCQAVWEHFIGTKLKRISSEGRYRPELGRFIQSSNKGFADLHGIYQGRAVYIETKQANETQLKSQRAFEQWVKNGGGYYFIVRSFDDMLEIISRLLGVPVSGLNDMM